MLSEDYGVVAELIPIPSEKKYAIQLRSGASEKEMSFAHQGTVRSGDGRGQDPYLIHELNGIEYRTKISTLRGDFRTEEGATGNRLRMWGKSDFLPRQEDFYQERLYAILWMKPAEDGSRPEYEFRSVATSDLMRDAIVNRYIEKHFSEWQEKGWIPDMRIEPGAKTIEPIRTRGLDLLASSVQSQAIIDWWVDKKKR